MDLTLYLLNLVYTERFLLAETWVGLMIIVLLLICSGLVSASETAFFSLTENHLDTMNKKNAKQASLIRAIINNPQKLLATILISNNLVNISIVILVTFLSVRLFDFSEQLVIGFLFEFVIITALILLFGEMMPKIFANKYPLKIAGIMAKPMKSLGIILHPLSYFLIKSTSLIERRIKDKKQNLSMDELSKAIEITPDDKTYQQEKKILKRIVKFGDIDVSNIMKPRIDVTAVQLDTKLTSLLQTIKDTGFSRYPVYRESFDDIAGIIHIKDLLDHLNDNDDYEWQNLIRPSLFVPENKKINDLLNEFREKKIHMAIVVDEYGGTSGIITFEDILEEIVGEINDEYDVEEDNISFKKIAENLFVFEGKTSLNDFCKITGIADDYFNEVKSESASLAGLILELTRKMPHRDDIINFKKIQFTIELVNNRRIIKIKVKINDQ